MRTVRTRGPRDRPPPPSGGVTLRGYRLPCLGGHDNTLTHLDAGGNPPLGCRARLPAQAPRDCGTLGPPDTSRWLESMPVGSPRPATGGVRMKKILILVILAALGVVAARVVKARQSY